MQLYTTTYYHITRRRVGVENRTRTYPSSRDRVASFASVPPECYSYQLQYQLSTKIRPTEIRPIYTSIQSNSNPSCGGCGIHECFGLLGPTRDLSCRVKARFVCPMRTRTRPFLCSHAMHLLQPASFYSCLYDSYARRDEQCSDGVVINQELWRVGICMRAVQLHPCMHA